MANPIVNASSVKCSMSCSLPPGVPNPKAPSYPVGLTAQFLVPPVNRVNVGGVPAANIMDTTGKVVFPPSNSCQSQTNPTVIAASNAATVAAVGTPMFVAAPCIPLFASPWTPGCTTCMLAGKPMLNNSSKLMCTMGGTLEVVNTAAKTVTIP
ncbi:MAG: DUF4280 domain-containing protein [Oscillospiraceae bacterium]|nr:DUF4280 domain-containing protein [Oscillospiraceae bacterium]